MKSYVPGWARVALGEHVERERVSQGRALSRETSAPVDRDPVKRMQTWRR
jgi:hypothetical protein